MEVINLIKSFSFYLAVFLVIPGCNTEHNTYSHADSMISISGRTLMTDSATSIYWSGTSLDLKFEGTGLSFDWYEETGDNYYNVFLDDTLFILRPPQGRNELSVVSDLESKRHELTLIKRTEWNRGEARFYSVEVEGTLIPSNRSYAHTIEVFGNSITAGYGVEDYSEYDSPDSIYTNFYNSYAAITARNFDAEIHAICLSGIGIMIGSVPIIMPELFDRVDPRDSHSKWDFAEYQPELVIVNLLQNDSWLVNMPEHYMFKRTFTVKPDSTFIIDRYSDFISTLRTQYPESYMICMLGNMDITRSGSPWLGYVEQAVNNLKDDKVFTFFQPYKNTPGHPRVEEQKEMADALSNFIEMNLGWETVN